VLQRRLFDDEYRVFHDPLARTAPLTEHDYLASEHLTVVHEATRRTLDIDDWLLAQGLRRRVVASVPAFAGVAGFVRGGPWLVTAPGRLREGVLRGLADAPVPLAASRSGLPMLAMYMVWHVRHQQDPLHRWLRQTLVKVADSAQTGTFHGCASSSDRCVRR
jgi:DNA-binding transcriptional LysR family regulator